MCGWNWHLPSSVSNYRRWCGFINFSCVMLKSNSVQVWTFYSFFPSASGCDLSLQLLIYVSNKCYSCYAYQVFDEMFVIYNCQVVSILYSWLSPVISWRGEVKLKCQMHYEQILVVKWLLETGWWNKLFLIIKVADKGGIHLSYLGVNGLPYVLKLRGIYVACQSIKTGVCEYLGVTF